MGPNTSSVLSTAQATSELVIKKLEHLNSSITKMKETLDNTNWAVWHKCIRHIFILCGIDPYIYRQLKRPDPAITDPTTVDDWDANDIYAQILITNNINKDQMVHIHQTPLSVPLPTVFNPRHLACIVKDCQG